LRFGTNSAASSGRSAQRYEAVSYHIAHSHDMNVACR
jgi:hypothetical protein